MRLNDLINAVSPLPPASPSPAKENESGSIFDLALAQVRSRGPSPKRASLSGEERGSLADQLVEGWIPYFWKADQSIRWIAAEREHSLWLCPLECPECHGMGFVGPPGSKAEPCPKSRTLLVGRIDAVGQTEDGELFFGEWKSAKPPWKTRINEWKLKWLMSPQALTYGVFADAAHPGLRRFTVRIAYKSSPPTYDYDWFWLKEEEIAWWRTELLRIADEIRQRRREGVHGTPWSPNMPEACFKYGPEYVCPRFHPACSQLKWGAEIPNSAPRIPHLEVERDFLSANSGSFGQPMRKDIVILDATRVEKWMGCRERYRGEYELGAREPEGDALDVGSQMHALLETYYAGRISTK